MITLAWYLLKVIIASGILCGYYFIALRNKVFHSWNRFYLLASVIITLTVPLMKINIFHNESASKDTMITMLQTINAGDEAVSVYTRSNTTHFTLQNAGWILYSCIICFFLVVFFITLYKINRLRKKYPVTALEDINFYATDARETPFSFFRSIFWNISIDVHSKAGKQIFNHEIAHIKEKHSYDKAAINIILAFFWINPFFWLIRKELNMIHEFIADKKAVEDSDLGSFAEMILHTVYPSQHFTLTNNFFYSPLKRRILMLTKNNNPKVNYFSRLMVLPIAALVFFGFTIHVKNLKSDLISNNKTDNYKSQNITVVIDAGHGGSDFGAMSADGLKEKDINLAIAKKIAVLNTNDHIKILLSRSDDRLMNPKERVEFANENHPDLFISIHINAADKSNTKENGFSVLIDKNNSEKNKLLASALINELQKIYTTQTAIGVHTQGVWVLDHNICPATLIECGYLTNTDDVKFITNVNNQDKIARNILNAINDYVVNGGTVSAIVTTESMNTIDTTPALMYKKRKVKRVSIADVSPKINITYEDGTTETITKAEASRSGLLAPPPPPPAPVVGLPAPPPPPASPADITPPPPPPVPSGVLYIIDGNKSTRAEADRIDKNDLKSINILKGSTAANKYGNAAKNGVIEITTIAGSHKPLILVNGRETSNEELNKIDASTIESISVLKDSGVENNGVVNVQLKNDAADSQRIADKIFTQLEQPASFPGGSAEWIKYITQAIQKNISSLESDKKNTGTCVVKFIVNADGSISNVEAATMKGTKLSEVAVNALKQSPRWIPGKQNDHIVASYVMKPVSFKISDDLQ